MEIQGEGWLTKKLTERVMVGVSASTCGHSVSSMITSES